jgi:predicted transcriptional regulator
MTYRSRTDITAQILEAANGGVTKTRIMYKALLGYDQLKEYLMLLAKSDLLRYDLVSRTFRTTEKGLKFLNLYNQIDQLMKEEQHQI